MGKLEKLSVTELKERLVSAGLSSTGSKSELVVKLALWTHKANELRTGRLLLNDMTVPELRELKQGLGLKGTAATKASLIEVLEQSLPLLARRPQSVCRGDPQTPNTFP